MMEVTIKLSPMTMTKLQVYRQLTGKTAAEVSQNIPQMIDEVLSKEIVSLLGISLPTATITHTAGYLAPMESGSPQVVPTMRADVSPESIAEGLGDEDTSEEDTTLKNSIQEMSSRITDKDLAEDMSVNDPQSEAKAEPQFKEQFVENPEALFGFGVPKSPDEQEVPIKAKPQRRARVTPMTEFASDIS